MSILDGAFWHVSVTVSGTVLLFLSRAVLSPRFSVRFIAPGTFGEALYYALAKRSIRQKRSPGEIEIIDGAAFEDISWEYVAAITRNIDSN
jgi:hypothetical protein